MSNKCNHDELIEILDRTISWIENCDSKASIISSGIGVIAGIMLATDYLEKLIAIYSYMFKNVTVFTVAYLCCSFCYMRYSSRMHSFDKRVSCES